MRHRKSGRKFNKTSAHRKAMLMNIVTNLFDHEKIETTLPKAREATKLAEKIITLGRDGSLHKRRQALSLLNNNRVIVNKVFDEYAARYKDRNGGYTRVLKTNGVRLGDGVPIVLFELVDRPMEDLDDASAVESKAAEAPQEATA
ncbi:MAG: 50S ribosomal protein L17 [Planctomycetota bacterium]|nr:MAG: 50S ribosomal protein L17 [Planctomycetota bacterium]